MNNKAFIVCIELNPTALRLKFENGGFGNYSQVTKIMDNVYVFTASYLSTSESIRDSIMSYLGVYDIKLLVMKTSIDASWRLSTSLDYFLKENI